MNLANFVYFNFVVFSFYLLLFCYYWKEGNVLFNDALNTFCLLLYGVRGYIW